MALLLKRDVCVGWRRPSERGELELNAGDGEARAVRSRGVQDL